VNGDSLPITSLITSRNRNTLEIELEITGDKKVEMPVPVVVDEGTT
jgi:hypothetical protein